MPNLASVLYDPECWETPHQFNPDHFLDKDGNFVANEAFLPFSAGIRNSAGPWMVYGEDYWDGQSCFPLTFSSASRASGVSWGTACPNGALPDVCHAPQDLSVSTTRREPGPQAGLCLWWYTAASVPEDLCRASPEQPQP